MTTRTQYHADTAREELARARAYLDEDDLLQASEKGWGAAAQVVKAAAETRGWRHGSHCDLFAVITRLVDETGNGDIRRGFNDAGALHTNFYEGWLDRESVEANLARVSEFVEKVGGLAESGRPAPDV